jgi:hypothetical protein
MFVHIMRNSSLTTGSMLATIALGGMLAGSAARLHASTAAGPTSMPSSAGMGLLADDSAKGKHDCKGQNSCKGQGGCMTGDHGCKGKNSCKGKGGCATGSA